MKRHVLAAAIALLALVAALPCGAAPKPGDTVTVLCAGATRAGVYVAPMAQVPGQSADADEVSDRAFYSRFSRGIAPLQLALKPGEYVISVLAPAEYDMRDAMQRATGFIWDGFDQHAIVLMPETNRWRYGHCYVVTKEANQPLTVFAVFTTRTQVEQCATFAPSAGEPTRFAAGDDQATQQLEAANVPNTFTDEFLGAVTAGRKAILSTGATRWVVAVQRPDKLVIREGRGNANWSGHRLSVATPD